MTRFLDHSYLLFSILFTVASQIIMRWQVGKAGYLPTGFLEKIQFVISLLVNPWVITGILATFFAGICWMLSLTRFEVSYAYPFISLTYILVLFASGYLFNEAFTLTKIVGTFIVVIGLIVVAKG